MTTHQEWQTFRDACNGQPDRYRRSATETQDDLRRLAELINR